MREENDVYINVPGRGSRLDDGTWWTQCSAVAVGEITKVLMIPGNYTKVCEAIEIAVFDGLPFTRWKRLPDE